MSTLDEHRVLVEGAGAWGTDNLGQFEVTGPDAGALVNRVATADMSRLSAGRFAHALLLRDDASILERVTVYRFPDRVMLLIGPHPSPHSTRHRSAPRSIASSDAGSASEIL